MLIMLLHIRIYFIFCVIGFEIIITILKKPNSTKRLHVHTHAHTRSINQTFQK